MRSELDALRQEHASRIGARDAEYIRTVRAVARASRAAGRLRIHFSLEPVSWTAGVLALATHKVLENMEIGHAGLHGQYAFLHDPELSSATYEWDMVGTARSWKRAHNATHHGFTNVIGLPYETGSLASQFASAMRRLVRFAGPGARTSWRGRRPGVTARAARSACEPVLGDGSSGARREGPASRGGSRQRPTPTAWHSGAAVGAVTPS